MLSVRAVLLATVLAAIAGGARAGDFAEREILGFSPDGRYFAFEEYGVQDGSGFPYSNVYVIDVADDTWVSGTPVRVTLEGPDVPPENARAEAREKAADTLERLDIGQSPAHVASNPATQLNADFNFVLVRPRLVEPPIDKPVAFKLSSYPLPGEDYCPDYAPTKGFQLDLIHGEDDEIVTLQRDERIPSSRGCAFDYQIADIYTYYPEGGAPVFAVLVRIWMVGFEGPDGRFLALTGELPTDDR